MLKRFQCTWVVDDPAHHCTYSHSTTWSTDLVSTYPLPMTKEYNWQIINMSVMPFFHQQAACTYHVCAPSSRLWCKCNKIQYWSVASSAFTRSIGSCFFCLEPWSTRSQHKLEDDWCMARVVWSSSSTSVYIITPIEALHLFIDWLQTKDLNQCSVPWSWPCVVYSTECCYWPIWYQCICYTVDKLWW